MAATLIWLVIGLSWPLATHSPREQPATHTRAVIIDAAREIMTKARYCALITIGPDGQPHARAVDAFVPEADMTVWIGTNPVTRKVQEIRHDPRVTLYYFDAAGTGYVTLIGRAEVVDDATGKQAYWKDDWSSFYANKNRGRDYVALRIQPSRLEIVSYTHKLLNDPSTWQPISVDFPTEERVTRATGDFDVKLSPQGPGDNVAGTSLGRMTIEKTFHGDLEGASRGEMLTAGTAVKDSAGYVAIERVTGTLGGRKGTFILQHTGTMTRGAPQLTISVVPDSATGELTGLTGKMTITIDKGKHSYDFQYALPPAR